MPRLTLRRPAEADAAAHAVVDRLVRDCLAADGQPPFNDQALVDLRTGARSLILASADTDSIVGAAIAGDGELEFAIDPARRGEGLGSVFAAELLRHTLAQEINRAWAHGDHPASRALAREHGFERTRTLLQLRMPLEASDRPVAPVVRTDAGIVFGSFEPGADEKEWVELNARVFRDHPEQGRLTVEDVLVREAEPWFVPGDVLVARDEDGVMIGYNWLKVEDGIGEIYVIGVDDSAAGRGLGRSLMLAGLDLLRERGCTTAALYVDEENERAVRLYRSLGFADHTIDVQYSRAMTA